MKFKPRYLQNSIVKDLTDKMVFVGGPRQVGKTTLAQSIGAHPPYLRPTYLNWDSQEDRRIIIAGRFPADTDLILFDELHKYRLWKNYLKGIFDKYHQRYQILVTGSTRLDLYRKGGDSLLGRYHYYRLHPFSLAELLNQASVDATPFRELIIPSPAKSAFTIVNDLLHFGGFPEPFLKHDDTTLRRWHNEYIDRLIKEDIRDLESLRDLSSLQILGTVLPDKVGAKLSLNALREDFQVAHKTISLWIDVLERFYFHFRIYPFAATTIKSLRKEPKLYLWDWSLVINPAFRLENLVASHLLKFTHYLYDSQGYRAQLHYLRDIEGREVDFLVTVDNRPWFAVEVKETDLNPSPHLHYFGSRLRIPFLYQVVKTANIYSIQDQVTLISIDRFLSALV